MAGAFSFERDIVPLLPRVAKPARYTGDEYNSIANPDAECVFALAYPDVYEVGMSNLGLRILYEALSRVEGCAVERVYLPWPDMADMLREKGLPLWTLETKKPLSACAVLGITLQYEMTFTNILELLSISGIPLRREDRTTDHPLIVAGGPCAFNPVPLAPWIDVFVLGDGDQAAVDLLTTVRDAQRDGASREAMLGRFARFEWAWIPGLKENAKRAIIHDLDEAPFPVRQIVPNVRAIQDRGLIEASRGCTNGCRFCHAGMTYRPVRERTPDQLVATAVSLVNSTGFDEISLASLSISDYTRLEELIIRLNAALGPRNVSFSLPSLHVDGFTLETATLVGELRKSGLTFAVEAGDPAMRARINKPVDDDHLMSIFRTVWDAGWKQVKLYFMIGFPGAHNEAAVISDFIQRAHAAAPKLAIHCNVGIFIPKPHTPLQWARQMSIEEGWAAIHQIRDRFKKGNVRISWHDPSMSFLEGVFSRGGEKAARLLEEAWKRGARFDAWDEHFSFSRWKDAMDALGYTEEEFLAPFASTDDSLPWDGISGVAGKGFLLRELQKYVTGMSQEDARLAGVHTSVAGENLPDLTEDCRQGCRSHCGVCTPETGPRMAPPGSEPLPKSVPDTNTTPAVHPTSLPGDASRERHVYRIRFDKTGLLKFISHLDMQQHLIRIFQRSALPLSVSEGFNPKPRLSLVAPAMLGMATTNDILEIELAARLMEEDVVRALVAVVPAGLVIREARHLETIHSKLVSRIVAHSYRIETPCSGKDIPAGAEFVYRVDSDAKLKDALQARWGCDIIELLACGLVRNGLYVAQDDELVDAFVV